MAAVVKTTTVCDMFKVLMHTMCVETAAYDDSQLTRHQTWQLHTTTTITHNLATNEAQMSINGDSKVKVNLS